MNNHISNERRQMQAVIHMATDKAYQECGKQVQKNLSPTFWDLYLNIQGYLIFLNDEAENMLMQATRHNNIHMCARCLAPLPATRYEDMCDGCLNPSEDGCYGSWDPASGDFICKVSHHNHKEV